MSWSFIRNSPSWFCAPGWATPCHHQLWVPRVVDFVGVHEWGVERRYRLDWDAIDRLDAVVEELWKIWEDRVGSG